MILNKFVQTTGVDCVTNSETFAQVTKENTWTTFRLETITNSGLCTRHRLLVFKLHADLHNLCRFCTTCADYMHYPHILHRFLHYHHGTIPKCKYYEETCFTLKKSVGTLAITYSHTSCQICTHSH